MKKDLQTRKDVSLLVHKFYTRVRKDELIGPVFNSQIGDWAFHMNHLTNFWETNLFGVRRFKGNPMQVHIEVDQKSGNIITQEFFGQWLHLWFDTIDSLYEGPGANRLKNSARNMSTHLFIKMVMARSS